jgi:hypothetical protein
LTPVNLRNNDPDEPKPGDDSQSKEEIKECGHRSTLSVERDRAMPGPLQNEPKTAEIGGGFLKCLQDGSVRMPRFYR